MAFFYRLVALEIELRLKCTTTCTHKMRFWVEVERQRVPASRLGALWRFLSFAHFVFSILFLFLISLCSVGFVGLFVGLFVAVARYIRSRFVCWQSGGSVRGVNNNNDIFWILGDKSTKSFSTLEL